ncbi:P-loop NTPase fold protein [Achromobacter sp. DH1f]|uniref:KAP family P-loop NTPase fold protein n=1 Tax=Achromobacter sp. DH1f TaxID=1397275 RepID=UPI0012FE8E2B|nr:P-loop NTPase fold protein [Achromobacter sp. DH1f]
MTEMKATASSRPKPSLFAHDQPSPSEQADWLRYSEMARTLRKPLQDLVATTTHGSMVVGIEGAWGSGKTTLLGHLREYLEAADNVVVIEVAPWLNGDRQPLAKALLDAVSADLDKRRQRTCLQKLINRRSPMAKKLRRYASQTARMVSPLAALADGWLPGSGALHKVIKFVKTVGDSNPPTLSVADLRREIDEHLANSAVKYIVIYDDLDRLEPNEALEVIRLVRGVADFKGMLHILCYDRDVLSSAVSKGLALDDAAEGDRYLEKIVQLTFPIPLPEPRLLEHRLVDLALDIYRDAKPKDCVPPQLIDQVRESTRLWCANLCTPRQVKQIANQIRFSYASVEHSVHFADLCTLSILKVLDRDLYNWLADFLALFSYPTGMQAPKMDAEESSSLKHRLVGMPLSAKRKGALSKLVPAIKWREGQEGDEVLFEDLDIHEAHRIFDECRIGSPYHFRFYFALTGFSYMVAKESLDVLEASAEQGWQEALEAIRAIAEMPHPGESSWLTVLFNWIGRPPFHDALSLSQRRHLLRAMASGWDEFLTSCSSRDRKGLRDAISFATRFFANSVSERDEHVYRETVDEILNDCMSPHALATRLWTILHSNLKGRDRSQRDLLVLSITESVAAKHDFIRSHHFKDVLSAWQRLEKSIETPEERRLKGWFTTAFKEDSKLVEVMEQMMSDVPPSASRRMAAPVRTVEEYWLKLLPDPSTATTRIKRIAGSREGELAVRAQALLTAIVHGNHQFALENGLQEGLGPTP